MLNIKFNAFSSNVKLILITSLLSNIGIFMVIPFLAIYLSKLETITTAQVGLIIGVAFWCQRAGSFFGGLMSDYLHIKGTMLLGLTIRIPGYLLVGYVDSFYLLLIVCSIIGLGSSIYLPAAKSYLVKVTSDKDKIDVLSTRMIFSNIGVAIGPVIGMSVFTLSPSVLFVTVAVIFSILTLMNLKLEGRNERLVSSQVSAKDFGVLLANRMMIAIALLMFLFMAFYMQIEVTIPMFSSEKFDNKIVSYIFICNAFIVIFFQSAISKWACNGAAKKVISITFILFSLCFLLMNMVGDSYTLVFLAVIAFSFAEIIIQIRLDYDATNVSKKMVATTFGIMSLAGAFGGLVGSYIGTLLYTSGLMGISIWGVLSLSSAIVAMVCILNPDNESDGIIK